MGELKQWSGSSLAIPDISQEYAMLIPQTQSADPASPSIKLRVRDCMVKNGVIVRRRLVIQGAIKERKIRGDQKSFR